MGRQIDLRKTVYDKDQFLKVVDTSFKTFVKEEIEDEVTLDEFFNLYNQLYFSIPVEGDNNSHEYLVKRSGELFSFERETQDIEELLNEITLLRERLLNSEREKVQLETDLELLKSTSGN